MTDNTMADSRIGPNCSNSVPSQEFLSWLETNIIRMASRGQDDSFQA